MKATGKRVLLLCALLFSPVIARASCQFYLNDVTSEVPGYLSFGDVFAQRDTPVGAVIATATTGAYLGGQAIAGCDEPWTLRWDVTQWKHLSTLGNSVYRTNIAGVGLRLINTDLGETIPYVQERSGERSYVVIRGDGIRGELIKTGDITGGMLEAGVLARGSVSGQFSFANVTLSGASVINLTSCTVTTPAIEVPLGEHQKSDFTGRGSGTAWQTFNIGLECDPGARINVRIDATVDSDAGKTDIMALDPDPSAATGVGIQIGYQDGHAVELGKARFMRISSSRTEQIKLQARYYQTLETIKTGTANATATFTLTYK